MEAVKRLPMISFELKNSPEPTSFHSLKQCIAEYYHEDPESYAKEFRELEQLRGLAVRPRVDFDCCSTVKRYYAQLHSLQNRFPLSSENELLEFSWKDIYSGSMWRSSNVKYEMASILYNIAALHSKLGIEEERSDPESMKIACTHFQCAAWAFGEMKTQYPLVLRSDLSPELMIFMQQICFAQAQECILEKSLGDNRKPAIIAKVTAQVISFYNAALTALFSQSEEGSISDIVGNKIYKDWLRYIKFKTSYLSSILFLYQGMHSEEQRKMGERVALYNAACEKLEEAKKESKGMDKLEVINEALTFVTDIVEGKRKNAKQENEFIYHESIPEISSISAVQGANLVQGISFEVTDVQVIGDDIFKRLVPMKTHEHLSVYSEEKANILRQLGAKIDDRDAELATFMASLNTESLNAMGQSQEKLPQGLVDRCAELSAKPNAIPVLVESMSNLADIYCDVEMTLKDIKKILEDESKQEENYQKQIGKRPTGHMTELSREYTKYFDAHSKAGESNDTLRKAMELHVSNLKKLSQPLSALRNQVPQADPIDDGTRKELQTLLNKVEEMKNQRDGIFNELRDQILNKDDITAQLIAFGNKDVEELFKKELQKYSQSVSIIEQNLVAQGNILKALTDTYAKHAMTLKSYNDAKLKREQFYSSLIASFDVYEDLMLKSAKGLDFYKKLQGNVQKLMSRVKAARDVQDEERQQILKNAMPKAPPVDPAKLHDSFNPMITTASSTSGGGRKLKDYLKSGMVPGMGGLRDELNKLPAVRPSPVGQENVMNQNPASCSTMNYVPGNYLNRAYPTDLYQHQQQMPYYPATDQQNLHSGSSLSSSSTSLNSDLNQPPNYGTANNQGYVNPIFQTKPRQGYDMEAVYKNNFPPANSYQQQNAMTLGGMNPYGTYDQQIQPATSIQQTSAPELISSTSTQQSSMSYNPTASNISYMNPVNQFQQPQTAFDSTQQFYQNQYQMPHQFPLQSSSQLQYPATQSPGGPQQVQQYPASQSSVTMQQQQPLQQQQKQPFVSAQPPNVSQYSGIQHHANQLSNAQSPGPIQNPTSLQNLLTPKLQQSMEQQFLNTMDQNSLANQQPAQQGVQSHVVGHQDKANMQNYYSYNSNNSSYMTNQYGEKFSQQNYSCFTPTINSTNSYMTSGETQLAQSQTTQSVNYNHSQEIVTNQYGVLPQAQAASSPLHQPYSIPTYSAAMNATATNNSEMHVTQSQNQITSHVETKAPVAPTKPQEVKSTNIDLLSGIDFSMTNPSIENILIPVSITEKKEVLPVPIPMAPETSNPVKLNEDLAELDFNSLGSVTQAETGKETVSKKAKYHEDPFEDASVLKQFHKEVEGLEKFMETLTVKTMNGTTPLAGKWMELQDLLVKDEAKRSVSIARLFPDKNRSVDCLPYDHARVLLPTVTDNYINAVLVKDCGPVGFILTQTPMTNTVNDYWEMVWSQKSNILVCLHSVKELLDPFWPQKIEEEKIYGDISVVLTKQFEFSHCHEKVLKLTKHGVDSALNVSLLQIKEWKKNSSDHILDVAQNIITCFKQKYPEDNQQYAAIILNCMSGGAERSGLLTLGITTIFTTMQNHAMRKPTLMNVVDHWFRICSQRKGALDSESLIQVSLEIVLNNAHRILNKRGIMTSYQMKTAEKLSAAEKTEKSVKDTGLDSLDPFWKFK